MAKYLKFFMVVIFAMLSSILISCDDDSELEISNGNLIGVWQSVREVYWHIDSDGNKVFEDEEEMDYIWKLDFRADGYIIDTEYYDGRWHDSDKWRYSLKGSNIYYGLYYVWDDEDLAEDPYCWTIESLTKDKLVFTEDQHGSGITTTFKRIKK